MPEFTHGKIIDVALTDQMKQSYIDYAMSVIVNRALPDVRDGLKPVHRRILYAMSDMGMTPSRPHRKSARVVGEVLGKYHPHGETALYDTLVRMAQDFNMRYPLADGHGNFGSIDGDPAAAMRYTEVRMAPIAMEMLRDMNKDTVDFVPNFDDTMEEPSVLPARYPNLLVNGSSGIAVGMATNIPPHNLREVVSAVLALIEDPDISSEELMRRHVPGPDFPTGGMILGRNPIREAYRTGRGIITMRAVAHIENLPRNKSRIVISEIPYQTNKSKLIEKIAELVRNDTIEGITDLRDESDREGLRIVIEISRSGNPHVVLNKLYKQTPLQSSFGIIMLALVDDRPQVMSLKEVLSYYLEHQKEVVTRRTRYLLEKARARAHILEGLLEALDDIDLAINLIRSSETVDEARTRLMEAFELSEKQAQAILDMRLQRLTGLEREKVKAEFDELSETIEYYEKILADEGVLLGIIREELKEIAEEYGDERRTRIRSEESDIQVEDLIAEEDVVVTLSHQGYIKRMPVNTYRRQRRGGRGMLGMSTKEDDFVEQMFITTTHRYLLFFTNKGLVFRVRAHEIPKGSRRSRGKAIVNLIPIDNDERITAVMAVKDFEEDGYFFMATERGYVKKVDIKELDSPRRNGLIAISLREGDQLIGVKMTDGQRDILIVTRRGQAIRFPESEVRSMSRKAMGVIGIRLGEGDVVVGMETADEDADVLVVSRNGFGKRTAMTEYRLQGRAGKGLRTINMTDRTGPLVGVKVVKPGNEIMLVTAEGVIIRTSVDSVSRLGRNTQGVTLMRPDEDDHVVSVAHLVASENGAETDESEVLEGDLSDK